MKYQGNWKSVNCCRKCGRNLHIQASASGITLCPDCSYFKNIGVETIEQYNNWLRK